MLSDLLELRWTYLYLVLIPTVNWSFAHVPTIAMSDGGNWSPMSVVTGLILVFRDFAQREVGHYIAIPLAIGIAISFVMAPPAVALASAAAFAISEIIDWAIFTITKRPLSGRVLWSTGISAPADSAVFWFLASFTVQGVFNWSTIITSILSKWAGTLVVFYILKRKEALSRTRA